MLFSKLTIAAMAVLSVSTLMSLNVRAAMNANTDEMENSQDTDDSTAMNNWEHGLSSTEDEITAADLALIATSQIALASSLLARTNSMLQGSGSQMHLSGPQLQAIRDTLTNYVHHMPIDHDGLSDAIVDLVSIEARLR